MNMIFELVPPSPKTVCVPVFHRSQFLQSLAASASSGRLALGGMRGLSGECPELGRRRLAIFCSMLSEWRPIYAEDETEWLASSWLFRSSSHPGPTTLGCPGNFRSGRRRQDSMACTIEFFSTRAAESLRRRFHSVEMVLQFAELLFDSSLFAPDGGKKVH